MKKTYSTPKLIPQGTVISQTLGGPGGAIEGGLLPVDSL